MSLQLIRQLLETGGARRLSAEYPLWELSAPWWPLSRRARRLGGLQAEILGAGLSIPGSLYFVSDKNPQEFDVGGTWAHAHRRTWSIPDDCDLRALLGRALEAGDWTIYSRHEALDPEAIPDAFEVAPGQVANFSLAHAVPLLVTALQGNRRWKIWVENVSEQHEAAA